LIIIDLTLNSQSLIPTSETVSETIFETVSASQNVYAVNYQLNVYATVLDPSTVQIFNFEGILLESFTINNTKEVSSLSFNQNN
jgi:hypothetical protein